MPSTAASLQVNSSHTKPSYTFDWTDPPSGADLTYAWPTNEIAVMGAEGAANVIFRRQIADAEDPEAMRARMVKEYKTELMHPYYAVERGLVDDVIDPAETREVLIRSLDMLRTKHADLPARKHGNPPQ